MGSTSNYRYFIFVVLHEIAHAYLKHLSPKLDSLTDSEMEAQEDEADKLALQWFNGYVEARANSFLPKLTRDEIDKAKTKSTKEREKIYRG